MIEPILVKLTSMLIFEEEEPIEISGAITSLIIKQEEDFAKPLYILNVNINTEVIEKFNEKKVFSFSVLVEEDISEEHDGSQMSVTKEILLTSLQYPNVEDHLPADDDQTGIFHYVFLCFESNHILIEGKEITSTNYRNTTLKDSVGKIISNYRNHGFLIDKVCISRFDNNKKYAEVQNKDKGLITSLRTIDKDKGFFKEGMAHCYIENKVLYIVNKYRKCIYTFDANHINDITLSIGSKFKGNNDEDIIQDDYSKEIYNIGLQSGYTIVNSCSKAKHKYGKTINFYSDNYDSTKSVNASITLDIADKYLSSGKTLLQDKTSKANDNRLNHSFSMDHFENALKKNLITAVFFFRETRSTLHNYNTQYEATFLNELEEKYNGTFISVERQITYTYRTDGSFACDVVVKARNVSVDLTTN